MDPSNVQEMDQVEEIDENLVPYRPVTQDDAPEPIKPEESSEENLNETSVSAFDMILKALWKITIFANQFPGCQESRYSFTDDDDDSILPHQIIHISLLNNNSIRHSLSHPLEANGVFDLFVKILDVFSHWDPHFEVYEVTKKICNRCKMDMEYPVERSYGLIMIASSLREVKSAFKDFTFENIIKVIRMNLKMPCDKEGCGKQSYVQRMIKKLPSVFTIALEWRNNETEGEILDTISVLATEIDISSIYQYEGDSASTKYRLVSMVCLCGDQYNCVAYENKRWVRHFPSQEEIIGDWKSVVSIFVTQNIRPQILFFENI